VTPVPPPQSVAATIQMLRGTHKGCFLIVEGDRDVRLLAKFVDSAACSVQPGFTKQNVIDVVTSLRSSGFEGVLGLVDRDFGNLLGRNLSTEDDVLQTDSHDFEVDMVCCAAFDAVMAEYALVQKVRDFERLTSTSIRDRIFLSAKLVGALRLLSARESMNLNFDRLDFSRFVDPSTLAINEPALLADTLRGTGLDLRYVRERLTVETGRGHALRQLVDGKDFLRIWLVGLRSAFGSGRVQTLNEGGLASSLRIAYSLSDFQRTALHRSIQAWEASHPTFNILPR
jgi:hypothetical protein